jgi:hypothetical protein
MPLVRFIYWSNENIIDRSFRQDLYVNGLKYRPSDRVPRSPNALHPLLGLQILLPIKECIMQRIQIQILEIPHLLHVNTVAALLKSKTGQTYIDSQDILRRVRLTLSRNLEVDQDAAAACLAEFVRFGLGMEGVGAEGLVALELLVCASFPRRRCSW